MNRNGLFALIGVLAVLVAGLAGYLVYQQSQQPQLQISVDKGGIKVKGHG
jgi:hypothetical protein